MSEPLNSSFIPKRNVNRPSRQNATQRVFVGTLLIQILFFATLLATLGVLVYEKNLKEKLNTEIISFNNEISTFSEVEMERVIDLDNRMNQVSNRLTHTASIVSIFEAMEESTLQTVQIQNLKLDRVDDSQFTLESSMETDSFDSVMFQRGVLERNDNLVVTKVADLKLINSFKEVNGVKVPLPDKILHFKANLAIDTEDVPHKILIPATNPEVSEKSTTSEAVINASEADIEAEVNQENI